jgi:large subunit ribosomal protein L18
MKRLELKSLNASRRKNRVRSTVSGTAERPRLTVFVSNLHIHAQIIDDTTGKTLAAATTVGNKALTGTMTERAAAVGAEIAKKAKAAKVNKVVFDRNGKQYHGRIKALAEAARKDGLEF